MRIAALVIAAACGDNATADAGPHDAVTAAACTAALTGNVTASLASPTACPTVHLASGHRVLDFDVPIAAIHAPLTMSFDLGVVAPTGVYTSETVAAWSARASPTFGTTTLCIFAGGSATAPQGSFTLELDAIDVTRGTAHGTARLELVALTTTGVPCGPLATERVELAF